MSLSITVLIRNLEVWALLYLTPHLLLGNFWNMVILVELHQGKLSNNLEKGNISDEQNDNPKHIIDKYL